MKLLLIILILLLSIKGMTQVPHDAINNYPDYFFKDYHKKLPASRKDHSALDLSLYNQPVNKNQTVYFALQDNMPCVVPLSSSIPYMPNVWTGKGAHDFSDKIPNPADAIKK